MAASNQFEFTVGRAESALESRVTDLRACLELIPAALLSEHTGAAYLGLGQGRGEFHFSFLDSPIVLTYPDFRALTVDGESLPVIKLTLLLYYFMTSDGSPLVGKWISFADLPEGRVYGTAFQGYTGDSLAKMFKLDLTAFRNTCESMRGDRLSVGDASYRFRVLPKLVLAVVYHLGDDDFPSTCKILFDESAAHFLPTEGCAILGSMFTQKLLSRKST